MERLQDYTTISRFNKFLSIDNKEFLDNPYTNNGIGFGLETSCLQACVRENSNNLFWLDTENYASKYDLRNPSNKEIKKEIFKEFGLEPDKSYGEN